MTRAVLTVHGVEPPDPADPPGFCVPRILQIEVPDEIEVGQEVRVVLLAKVTAIVG